MAQGTFATAINCMDGRVIDPVTRWMRAEIGVDYVDMITEAGPDKICACGIAERVESVRRRVLISTEKHGSRTVAVVAHYDCGGNPGPKEMHVDLVRQSVRTVRSWDLGVRILGLWVDEHGAVEVIEEHAA